MRAAKRDYYELLGIARNADAGEIKRAYRELAMRYHPDHNPDDSDAEEVFKRVTEAYAVLSDSDRRRRYDQFGDTGFGGEGPGTDIGGLGDMLESLFDDVFRRKQADQKLPKDLRYTLKLGFTEAALGVERTISYERQILCQHCHGKRSEPGFPSPQCSACRGRGQVRFQRGFFTMHRQCSRCQGSGVRNAARCRTCLGEGSQTVEHALAVKIPAGVEHGAVRTVRGAGEQNGRGSGDLHVHIEVAEHELFTRKGADIYCEVPIGFPQAALGAQIEVPTLAGPVMMRLPAGTQSGKMFRLRGRGMPALGGYGKGDLFVTMVVEVPQEVSPRQRALLEELAQEMEVPTHLPKTRNFVDKLKKLL